MVAGVSLCGMGLLAGALGGCAVSMPMGSLMPEPHEDETTGSIAKPKLTNWIPEDDWPSAKPAFAKALDETSGAAATWDNPKSGVKGRFVAIGGAYAGVSGRCRAFQADIDAPKSDKDKILEGTACASKSGEWQVTEIKPVKKS